MFFSPEVLNLVSSGDLPYFLLLEKLVLLGGLALAGGDISTVRNLSKS